jgi:hypothetical protein
VLLYLFGEELDAAAELSAVLPVFFCAFLAAGGAAISKGTATTVSRVDVNSFSFWFLH